MYTHTQINFMYTHTQINFMYTHTHKSISCTHTHTNQFHVHTHTSISCTHTHKSISCTHTHKSISCTHTHTNISGFKPLNVPKDHNITSYFWGWKNGRWVWDKNTDMRRLTTGIRSEKCVVTRFRRCANVIECTYTNLDSIVYYIPSLYATAYCP